MAKDIYHNLVKQTYLDRHQVKLIIFDTQNPIIYAWKS